MNHPLDRPVWHALTGPQAALARRAGQALRIAPSYGPFAAAPPGGEADLVRLLVDPADTIWLVEPEDAPAPPGLVVQRRAELVQMIADGPLPSSARTGPEIVPLGEADVPEMTALALATKPGPWGPETWRYGQFYGIRAPDGRLAAMAGARMRPAPGFAEVSGVATWPEFRGAGHAARLIGHVMTGFLARGDVPFLHSYADNQGAIRLYEALGLRIRQRLVATILGKT
jgi:ribosomal protein S18 acetylase RimI-like enzyme